MASPLKVLTGVIALGLLAYGYSVVRSDGEKDGSPRDQSPSSDPISADADPSAAPAVGSPSLLPAGDTPSPTSAASERPGTRDERNSPIKLPAALAPLSIDPESERFLSSIKSTPAAKRMVLSATVIFQHVTTARPSEISLGMQALSEDIEKHREEFFALTDQVGAEKSRIPAPVLDGIFLIATQIEDRKPSPALHSLARKHIESVRSQGKLEKSDDWGKLTNAIVIYASSVEDKKAGLAEARKLIDFSDPNEVRAFEEARQHIPGLHPSKTETLRTD